VDRALRQALQRGLTELADGNRDAFHPVFVHAWPVVRAFVARHLPAAEAEDAAQQALLKAFERAALFDPRRDALAWLLGIAAYEIRTFRRRRWRSREQPAAELSEHASAEPSPEAQALTRDLAAALDEALGELTEGDAATLRAYARGEAPAVPGATFRKRVQRALARLRAAWRTNHGDV
jgi:RNA polymerase sigma-70 factor (ECF subfamily)